MESNIKSNTEIIEFNRADCTKFGLVIAGIIFLFILLIIRYFVG